MNSTNYKTISATIAEFMGGKYFAPWENELYHCPDAHWWFSSGEFLEDKVKKELKYHSSWDWQIPVYVKICGLMAGDIVRFSKVLSEESLRDRARWVVQAQSQYSTIVLRDDKAAGFKLLGELIGQYDKLWKPLSNETL